MKRTEDELRAIAHELALAIYHESEGATVKRSFLTHAVGLHCEQYQIQSKKQIRRLTELVTTEVEKLGAEVVELSSSLDQLLNSVITEERTPYQR